MTKRRRHASDNTSQKKAKLNHDRVLPTPSESVGANAIQSCPGKTVTLRQYIETALPHASRGKLKRLSALASQSTRHAELLDDTLVGLYEEPPIHVLRERHQDLVTFTQTQRATAGVQKSSQICDIAEVIGFAIWRLFQKEDPASRRPDHLLCHGFERLTSKVSDQGQRWSFGLPGIRQHSPNAAVDAMTTSPWTDVLSCLGKISEHIFSSLLFDCGLFVRLRAGHQNYYQLSGRPIFHLRRNVAHQPSKSASMATGGRRLVPDRGVRRSTAQISFVRNRMFYARANLNSRGDVWLGLMHLHVLNRYQRSSAQAQELRIMQYIFPRQFGLHNVFTSAVDSTETAQRFKDYTVRDDAVVHDANDFRRRLPKRLRGRVQLLVSKIANAHRRCSYTQLLHHYCPPFPGPPRVSIRPGDTRTGLPTMTTNEPPLSAPQAEETSFLAYATPAFQVSAFCRAAIRAVFPSDAFGIGATGAANWRHVSNMVDRFITARRFESLTLQEVAEPIKLRSLHWLIPSQVQVDARLSSSDRTKRLELLHELLYFVFDSFLIPLVRTNFHVTETSIHRNRLAYFRQDVWRKMCEPGFATIRGKMFEPLNPRQLRHALENSKLGYSQLRLLPKETGFRPITNLRRKPMKVVKGKRILGMSINAKLNPVFSVLNFERDRQPHMIGSALFSVHEISAHLKSYQAALGPNAPCQLYFVKMDVRSCFDTIPQGALLALVDRLLQCEDYTVIKHAESKQVNRLLRGGPGHLISRYISKARDAAQELGFSETNALGYAAKKRNVVFTATDQIRTMRLEHIRTLLRDHVQDNIVRIGRRHFRQIHGIPQGSILSSLLCNFFYSDFQRQRLDFLSSSPSLLLRLIDDFLLITTNVEHARQFVDAMAQGHADYGISINPQKSLVNFDMAVHGCKIPRLHGTSVFPYCGVAIHTKTLELSKDRQRRDKYMRNSLTVDTSGNVAGAFQRRILSSFRIQMHAMLLDREHNGRAQIIRTMFGCFVETAMKMHQYRIAIPRARRPPLPMLIQMCRQLFHSAHKLLTKVNGDAQLVASQTQVFWLGSTALAKVLSKKQSEYVALLRWLRVQQMYTQSRLKRSTRLLEETVQGAMVEFDQYVY